LKFRSFSDLRDIARTIPEPTKPTSLFMASEITDWARTWPDAKHLNASWPAMVSNLRVGRAGGLYVQPGTFDPLDPRMFAAHLWGPDKPSSRKFRAMLASEGKSHHRIIDVPPDRKSKSKPVWVAPWERRQMAWSDLWSGHADVGPAVWKGNRGACWGMSKADMRRIANAINGAIDRRQLVSGRPVELPFQAYPACTASTFWRAVERAKANGSCEPFEDALTNLWASKRRRRRPARRVRFESSEATLTVKTGRGIYEQVGDIEYGRSSKVEDKGIIAESYWPNGLRKWKWDRPRLIAVDPLRADLELLAAIQNACLTYRQTVVIEKLSRQLSVAEVAKLARMSPKDVRDLEKRGLAQLEAIRTPPPPKCPP
jgi:hypothetical protein